MQPHAPKSTNTWIVVGVVGLGVAVIVGGLLLQGGGEAANRPYARKGNRSEARLQLERIEKASKVQAATEAAFVTGSVASTPYASCCESSRSDKKCEVEAALWADPVWQALDFELDEPHLYRYSYDGTYDHFVARAIGDLDCDSIEGTYVLEGTLENGNPVFHLTEPEHVE